MFPEWRLLDQSWGNIRSIHKLSSVRTVNISKTVRVFVNNNNNSIGIYYLVTDNCHFIVSNKFTKIIYYIPLSNYSNSVSSVTIVLCLGDGHKWAFDCFSCFIWDFCSITETSIHTIHSIKSIWTYNWWQGWYNIPPKHHF